MKTQPYIRLLLIALVFIFAFQIQDEKTSGNCILIKDQASLSQHPLKPQQLADSPVEIWKIDDEF